MNLVLDFLHGYTPGERRTSTPCAYMWDQGHIIEALVPLEVTTAEIHYWSPGMAEAIAYQPDEIEAGETEGYVITAHMPNTLFETSGDIRVYVVVTDNSQKITTYEGYISVKNRAEPSDYVDPDPENAAIRFPVAAYSTAEMTNHDWVYLYLGDEAGYTAGCLYYWDGSAWADASTAANYNDLNNKPSIGGVTLVGNKTLAELGLVIDDTFTIPGAAADSEKTGEELTDLKEALTDVSATLTHKADVDGVVASAEQLLSDVGTEDKQPYLFRATPYDSTRVDEEVVGVSVGRNQLVGSDTSSVTVTSGHKLYTVIGGTASIVASAGTAISVTGGTDMVVDLTAWFGTVIADYAYTLETATAGSGVSFIKALLPGGYISYSAPKLESVRGLSGHKFVGFNAFDASTAVDGERWTASGTSSLSGTSRSVKIRCIPNATYYFKDVNGDSTSQAVYWFDADNNVIGYNGFDGSSPKSGTVTAPNNACYMAINMPTAYKSSTCINLSDPARNGQYEPYKETTYALDSDLTLRGILKLDASNHVYADGDRYLPDGTVERRYGVVVLDGTEEFSNISQYGSYYYISTTATYDASAWQTQDMLANVASTYMTGGGTEDKLYTQFDGAKHIRLVSSVFTTKQEFIDFLTGQNSGGNPLTIIYKTSTTTEETADPYASPQNCTPGGTEEYVYAEGGSGVPVGHNSKYLADLKGELERVMVAVPDAPSSNGTYTLKATVTAQGVTYGWVAE